MTRRSLLIFAGLWLATTLYIALFPTRHYTPDAVNNLRFIEAQNTFELWHSQHLLAQWPGYWTYQLAGGALRAWQAMAIAHALMAGAAVGVVYLTALKLTFSQRISIGTALALWFSYGFWHYQSDPDIYSAGYLAVALLLLAFVNYLQSPNIRRAVWLGLAGSLALLMHQLNIELGGLIGLALMWLAWRRATNGYAWRHVVLYALLCAVPTLALYFIGWQGANGYLVEIGGERLTFLGFMLRYFGAASSGEATWGVSFGLNTLPTAAYTFLLSWILPPLREELSLWSVLPPVMLLAGLALFAVHAIFALRKLPLVGRVVALVCALTLAANGFSGWWWQAGNVKFYLFMQLNLLLLIALYAWIVLQNVGWNRRIGALALALMAVGLVSSHVLFTLPYETRGGVFTVKELADQRDELASPIGFENREQIGVLRNISDYRGVVLEDFCENAPTQDDAMWWVVEAGRAADCAALDDAVEIGRFQADRTRRWWVIYELAVS